MRWIDTHAPLTLNDLFAAIPGIGLLLGYLFGLLVDLSQPASPFQVDETVASFKTLQLRVPLPHPEGEAIKQYRVVAFKAPMLDRNGRPVLIPRTQTKRGRGRPVVTQSLHEVVAPIIGKPPLKMWTTTIVVPPQDPQAGAFGGVSYQQVNYAPNVSWSATGIYELRKTVTFDDEVDRERLSVRGGVVAAVLSLIYAIVQTLRRRTKRENATPENSAAGAA